MKCKTLIFSSKYSILEDKVDVSVLKYIDLNYKFNKLDKKMPYIKHDHYYGYYSGEEVSNNCNCSNEIFLQNSNSLSRFYRSNRKQFLELLSEIDEEYRLSLINEEIKSKLEILENKSPEIFQLLVEGKIHDKFNILDVYENDNLLQVSYIYFLKILEDKYNRIEQLKEIDIKWTGDYKKFIDLYKILSNYNIIDADFMKFKRLFSLKDNLTFNSKIFDTVIIFFSLESKLYISPLTTESLISKGLILTKNGKTKQTVSLTQKHYLDNKSNFNKEISGSKCDEYVITAMEKFGIKIE